MKKKYISVLALACLFSASAMAQQKITGVVKDAQGEPVLGSHAAWDNKYIPHSIFFNNTNDSCCSRNYRKINE